MTAALPILKWYQKHKRDLPWRNTQNPYFIWLSEVILQQTRVEQGLPYYLKFVEAFPTIKDLANAKDDQVMKLWQGLGYYNRAKNMLTTARIITKEHGGIFPTTYDSLIELKGIGPYTAAAIASFAYNEPKAVVDGNVYRVLSRVFNIDEPINSAEGKKTFAELAQDIMDTQNAGLYNQAIMELGATICKPTAPKCNECDVRLQCRAYAAGTIGQLPVKIKKQKPKERFLHFFFIDHNGRTYIKQRSTERIWHNLFEPPFIETASRMADDEIITHPGFRDLFSFGKKVAIHKTYSTKHQLTHQIIFADFWVVKTSNKVKLNDSAYIAPSISELSIYPVHRLFDKFLHHYQSLK